MRTSTLLYQSSNKHSGAKTMIWTITLITYFLYILWKYWIADGENTLDRLPGPPRKPIIGSTLEFINLDTHGLFMKARQYAKNYGDRYVIKVFNRRILHIHNVNDVEVVLSHSKNIKKSKPYTFLEPWLGTGLLLSTGAKWHQRRKILTPTFHFNILKNFSEVIEQRSRDLVNRLKEKAEDEVNLMPTISDFTLATICETAMGTQLDLDKSSSTVEYKTAVMEIGTLVLSRLRRVWLHNEFLFKKFPIGKKFDICLKKVHNFADKVIAQRKKERIMQDGKEGSVSKVEEFGGKKKLALLDLLLEAESRGEIDLEGIKEEVNTFMFEGHDTTAMALTFALMLIADHEKVQERIYEELRHIFGASDRVPSTADFAEMKYLEAVIKETLRLYPSVPFIAREITDDFMLGDLPVKKGSEVAVHIYDLHRREDLYQEPDLFKPERFLEHDTRHAYAFVPFSAGPRNCIGQRFAMLEMKCLISEICRNFRLEPRVRGWRPILLADMLIRPAEDIYVKFIRRQ